jgi:hypothetical protein
MACEEFIDNLRLASRMLNSSKVSSEQNAQTDAYLATKLHAADLWLTPKAVEGYDAADFTDWPKKERDELGKEIAAFRAIAGEVPANKPATKTQTNQARKHLERAIQIARTQLVHEWLGAQQTMMGEAISAAEAKGWYFQMDEKEVLESLLGSYKAPRLRIRTQNNEVVLDPVARFGSGRRGVVDLVVMPTYETAYLVVFKDGQWRIVSPRGTAHSRPFTQETLVNTITKLAHS